MVPHPPPSNPNNPQLSASQPSLISLPSSSPQSSPHPPHHQDSDVAGSEAGKAKAKGGNISQSKSTGHILRNNPNNPDSPVMLSASGSFAEVTPMKITQKKGGKITVKTKRPKSARTRTAKTRSMSLVGSESRRGGKTRIGGIGKHQTHGGKQGGKVSRRFTSSPSTRVVRSVSMVQTGTVVVTRARPGSARVTRRDRSNSPLKSTERTERRNPKSPAKSASRKTSPPRKHSSTASGETVYYNFNPSVGNIVSVDKTDHLDDSEDTHSSHLTYLVTQRREVSGLLKRLLNNPSG